MHLESLLAHAEPLAHALRFTGFNAELPAEALDASLAPLHAAWQQTSGGIAFFARWPALFSEDRAVAAQAARERYLQKQWTHELQQVSELADWLHASNFAAEPLSHVNELAARHLPPGLLPSPQGVPTHRFLENDYGATLLAGLARVNPAAFRERAAPYLADIVAAASMERRKSDSGFHPNAVASVFAALTLIDSLDEEVEKLLLKLCGPKNVSVLALFTLIRHGHPKAVERLKSLDDLRVLEGAGGSRQSAQVLSYAVDAGPTWLRERLGDVTRGYDWAAERGTIAMARDFGVWDEATFERWLADAKAGVNGAQAAAVELPPLGDADFERVRACLRFPRDFTLTNPRSTPLSLEDARAHFAAIEFDADSISGFRSSLLQHAPLTQLVQHARRGAAHFDAVWPELKKKPAAQFVLTLATLPARSPVRPWAMRGALHLPDKLGCGSVWARQVRDLERQWAPVRKAYAPTKKAGKPSASLSAAGRPPRGA